MAPLMTGQGEEVDLERVNPTVRFSLLNIKGI
jgi:hypothetical protein